MNTKKVKTWLIIIFVTVCLCGIIYYSYKVIIWGKHVTENKKIQEKVDKTVIDKKTKAIDFNLLREENNDTVAYIRVNNTNIKYVVVKGNDNSYYLNHNFEKEWNTSGWIFADYHNRFDESDKNIVIYGHNTKDGSMFGTLSNVLKKKWYENKNNYKVELITENKDYYYQVFSTYSVIPEDYYINTKFPTEDDFAEFIKTLKSRSIYNYNVDVTGKDRILTLSSCIGDGDKRVVLHAKLIY